MKSKNQKKFNLFKFIFSILITEGIGILGSVFTAASVRTWYVTDLIKSPLNPPSWVFAPVWTLLFFLMGIALYLVWNQKNNLFWFWLQLLLNFFWSVLFFGLRSPTLAFYEILILWLAIFMTIIKFRQYHQTAAILLWPYLIWVSFASFLNYSVMILN